MRKRLKKKRAHEQKKRWVSFPCEKILEGVGMWSYGGFGTNNGGFTIPISPEYEPLRDVRRISEKNQRHALHVVYEGCIIIQTFCPELPVFIDRYYRIISVNRIENHVVCEQVACPKGIDHIVDYVHGLCILKDCVRTNFYWR